MRKNSDELFENLNVDFDEVFNEKEAEGLADELSNIIILDDYNGNQAKFEFLDLIEYKGGEYIVFLPVDDTENTGEVVILKVEDTDDEGVESYLSVDYKTSNIIFDIFKDKFKNMFEFDD